MRVAVSRFLVLIGCLLKLMGPQQSHLPYTPASSPCQAKGLWGGDSAWYWIEQTAARPKNGRPLQNLPPTSLGGFVAAVPSRAFRDGTGIFMVKLSHYRLWKELPRKHRGLE